ncbi:hypothetical protein [Thermoplasma acidophilum]|uniref:hypothetical protein n=1 Tax=Thermoplasma acidophilum TaxID=2303 RepID=UPI00064F5C4E|nr:hypothetical protein [Thermoplasma acidophilum]
MADSESCGRIDCAVEGFPKTDIEWHPSAATGTDLSAIRDFCTCARADRAVAEFGFAGADSEFICKGPENR